MSAETEWRWADPEGQQRLVRTDELRAALANGAIPPNAPVWRVGWGEWKPAHDVPELTTSALAAANGVVPNIPPPPLFVVAAQSAFETPHGPPVVLTTQVEPPPPPRYVPAPVRAAPAVPPAPASSKPSSSSRLPPTRPPVVTPPLPSGASRPPPSTRAPISQRMSATEALKRSVPSRPPQKPAAPGGPRAQIAAPVPAVPPATDTQPELSAADKKAQGKSLSVPTVFGVPRIADPRASAPPKENKTPPPPAGRSTLLFDGSAPSGTMPPRASSAPPIVAPGPGNVEKNAVTRPPPADLGTVRVGTPQSEPRPKFESVEEISGSMLIEQTETQVRVERPRAPSIKPSKPPPPGLKALASGAPRLPSRPPAPPIDGYETRSRSPSASSITSATPDLIAAEAARELEERSLTPPMPLVGKPPTPASGPQPPTGLSPPTLLGMGPIPSPGPPPADLLLLADAGPTRAAPPPEFEEGHAPPWLEGILQRVPRLRPIQQGRPIFFLPVVGGLAALVLLLVFGLLVRGCLSLFSSDKATKRVKSVASASPASVATGPDSDATNHPTVPALDPTAAPRESSDSVIRGVCRVTGTTRTLAPSAMVPSGVEAVALGRSIGVGFATSPKEGVAIEVDAVTLNTLATARTRGADIKRVTPILDRGRVFAAADVDKRKDLLTGGRTIVAPTPFEIGVRDGHLAWAPRGAPSTTPLWALAGDAPVEALRAAADGGGYAIVFRRGASIFSGAVGPGMKPLGPLQETRGLGAQVGSPAVAASSGALLVLWADRATGDEPWRLRMRRAPPTVALEEPRAFAPSGGPGAPFIAPNAVGLGAGRFFVVWTEGAGQNHQVRAVTLSASGAIEGLPIVISPAGVNAGQAQVALMPDGRGVVAYLASNAQGYEVGATAVSCAP